MSRWEPDARDRLREAALALFVEAGYEQTTVADIASRAGLTPRTFFRHFSDKREVLFDGSAMLRDAMIAALEAAPAGAAPMSAVAAALDAAAAILGGRRDFSRQRQALISANAELQERELIKLASLSAALAVALRTRGVAEPDASLAAESGIAVLRVAFDRWVTDADAQPLSWHMRADLDALRALTAQA